MTISDVPQLATVPVVLDDPEDWNDIAQQLAAVSSIAGAITPELLTMTVGSAVPILFAADRSGDADILRGTFSDQVIAQRRQQRRITRRRHAGIGRPSPHRCSDPRREAGHPGAPPDRHPID